jgi:inosine-uridine nucleoside N-ribohydrolase
MARKVILDMDPGVDEALALCLALADERLDVVAVTATGGNVPPEQATINVQTLVEQLDPSPRPRVGAASPEQMLRADGRLLFGTDGLCGVQFAVAELHHRHPSVKVICDEVRTAPSDVTIITTGPLSNVAAALKQQPDLASIIGHLIILGGTLSGPGNVTAAAEFNVYSDAEAARAVFHSRVTKTVIPIDVANRITFFYDLLEKLPSDESRTGRLLRKLLPGTFLAYRQLLGIEGIHACAAVAIVAAVHPELFHTHRLHGDVETEGHLTYGATVFDRRHQADTHPNLDVVVDMDTAGVVDCILRGLGKAE